MSQIGQRRSFPGRARTEIVLEIQSQKGKIENRSLLIWHPVPCQIVRCRRLVWRHLAGGEIAGTNGLIYFFLRSEDRCREIKPLVAFDVVPWHALRARRRS